MDKVNEIVQLVFKALALAMGVATIVLTVLHQFNPDMNILTGIGLFSLALAMLLRDEHSL